MSERDLNAHVDFRHIKQPGSAGSSSGPNLPSVEAINAATAALAARSSGADHGPPGGKMRGQQPPHAPSFSQNQFSQPPPPVMTNRGSASSNLITVPIHDNSGQNTTNEYSWTHQNNKHHNVPNIHQPPPNYYASAPPPSSANSTSTSQNQHYGTHVPSGTYDWTRTSNSGYRR